jgi:predicted amidophosphoribosyltransferase
VDFLTDLIQRHGWHVLGELAALVVASIVTAFWVRALVQGRARPAVCGSCGRVSSRTTTACPRCGEPLPAEG